MVVHLGPEEGRVAGSVQSEQSLEGRSGTGVIRSKVDRGERGVQIVHAISKNEAQVCIQISIWPKDAFRLRNKLSLLAREPKPLVLPIETGPELGPIGVGKEDGIEVDTTLFGEEVDNARIGLVALCESKFLPLTGCLQGAEDQQVVPSSAYTLSQSDPSGRVPGLDGGLGHDLMGLVESVKELADRTHSGYLIAIESDVNLVQRPVNRYKRPAVSHTSHGPSPSQVKRESQTRRRRGA